ncbi:hypothetical protein DI09_33p150 [Mitosporidium daphniae]|uniref:Man1/Src1-like C-terminal domain-containing protein n=1 Tax=Mitosporidium daphniae TaxID=1485682 RepID=A0A098VR29_9MICR|nr:uncharacterized protein DI09_33p150 [Mitosporidium daphniae]KGG51498.1 hypothetical protein DI09_33p150 [Mitosporidium daphniae]|eukprot:XP_013237925.1 uncharacterized protein DI09_33p150 [Mitosporidium daphniae]
MVADTFYEASSHSSNCVLSSTPVGESSWKDLVFSPIHNFFNCKEEVSICWECPSQASCIPGTSSWSCEPGYAPGRSWVFYRPVCYIDYKQQGAVDALVLAIEELLRRVLGEHLCAGGDLDSAPFISSMMLADRFKALDGPWSVNLTTPTNPNIPPVINSHRFEAFLAAALSRIAGRPESFEVKTLPVDQEQEHPNQTWFRAHTPSFSFECRFRLFCMRHRPLIAIFTVIVAIAIWIKRTVSRMRSLSKDAKLLMETVLDKLIQQDFLNRQDSTMFPSCIPVAQLRDALISGPTFSPSCNTESYRRQLWKEVSRLIHSNSNVRESTTLIRGEQHRVWEWIGPEVLKASASSGDISMFRRSLSSPVR